MIGRLKQSWQLHSLRREADRIRQDFVKCDGSASAIEQISERNVRNLYAIDEIKTNRLVRLADRYDVPVPSMLLQGNMNAFWLQSPFDKHVKVLNESARAALRKEIWEVRRTMWDQRTRWVPLLAALTGLLGTGIGLVAALHRWL